MSTLVTETLEKTQETEAKSTVKIPQCHWISNTHWDREWRYSMQRTRHIDVPPSASPIVMLGFGRSQPWAETGAEPRPTAGV
jgi:hypothetical protein